MPSFFLRGVSAITVIRSQFWVIHVLTQPAEKHDKSFCHRRLFGATAQVSSARTLLEPLTGVWRSIVGGVDNTASGTSSFVGGGNNNLASNTNATVGGGENNTASGAHSGVVGGLDNTTSGTLSVISGGSNNTASGINGAVGGGSDNLAGGDYSFVIGCRANNSTAHEGVFLFADNNDLGFASNADNQFRARATGGVQFVTGIDGSGKAISGVQVPAGSGSWSSLSDRNAKRNFSIINPREILQRAANMPILKWNYKSQNASVLRIGPMAPDFYQAFDVDEDEKHITTVAADGVSLAAIQGLNEQVALKKTRVRLKWNAVECATVYQVVVRRTFPKGPVVVMQQSWNALEYKTKKLEKGTTYYWSVRACNPSGCQKSQRQSLTIQP